jgi:recombination protein RecR
VLSQIWGDILISVGPLQRLSECLAELPGVGRRSADRMAMRLARDPDGLLARLSGALAQARDEVTFCSQCGSVTTSAQNPCRLCTDPGRDPSQLCVVESAEDIGVIERSGAFRGHYHALSGRLSAMRGEGAESLRINELVARIQRDGVREVVLALNGGVESDGTAHYLAAQLASVCERVTRLAYGLPAGSGIQHMDAVTLGRALDGRQNVEESNHG